MNNPIFMFQEYGQKQYSPISQLHLPLSPWIMHDNPGYTKLYHASGYEETHLIRTAMTRLNKNMCFVDVGAHAGMWSTKLAPYAKHTYAFECAPRAFCFLCSNILLSQQENNITPYRVALGNQNCEVPFYEREHSGLNGCIAFETTQSKVASYTVEMRTLDSYRLKSVGLIKIDVEGYESEVLKGAKETLELNNYPPIIFESWSVSESEYNVHGIHNSEIIKIKNEIANTLMEYGYTQITSLDHENYLAERII